MTLMSVLLTLGNLPGISPLFSPPQQVSTERTGADAKRGHAKSTQKDGPVLL